MPRRFAVILCLIAIACSGAVGCASMMGKSFNRNAQWEPDVEESEAAAKPPDWRSGPSSLRNSKERKSEENVVDRLIWSDQARDINRSLGGSL